MNLVEAVGRNSEKFEMHLAPIVLTQIGEIRLVLQEICCAGKQRGCKVSQGSMNLWTVLRFALT